MSLVLRSLLVLPVLAISLPAMAMMPCGDWGGATTSHTSSSSGCVNGYETTTNTTTTVWSCRTPGVSMVRILTDETTTVSKCGGIVVVRDGGWGSDDVVLGGDEGDVGLDGGDVGIVSVLVSGTEGIPFDVVDEKGLWVTSGTIGEWLTLAAPGTVYFESEKGEIDAVDVLPF